ncbi:phenylpropionate dioxygenase-like ring-hydroxylating dioxygenase large terminal subunit [Caulobacter ginsengisoli]|uniref:Phenylpropionate dioxygenase-like ring-hydroxylating dioxygenase large terminal subunit n=1 Tax=Caulobacter ginsengisoli TaxID=400775 RepID=A0ABU0IPR9_9CAUL|nr:aromatic ring-hydroxylating dioxygenase subunit alpha [Caulobacter ginsengisoli]MDQ0464003.1 phenylpropionate dioxygenase-like ring-hydroxylating dioxygenase large terminal subunit [Caulobacter ginsengisoli]
MPEDAVKFHQQDDDGRPGLADEPTVIERLLGHIDHQTTDLADTVWREPVEHYRSPERFQAELSKVMRRTPTPFCPSAALPRTGSYLARDAAMIPILAVRGADGQVRAFRNACRHRGAQVAEGHGCKAALACPYHGWTYGLDGRLRGIPHPDGFPGVDKAEHGLVPVGCFEANGIVFVTQDGEAKPDLDLIPDLIGEGWRFLGAGEQLIPANWKIVTEGVLEGYHIRSTHAETFFPRQYDNLNLVEAFGRGSRISYPYQNIERLRDAPPAERRTEPVMTQVYHLFPNAAVATFPTHRVLTIFEPLAIDRTVIVSYSLTRRPEGEEEQAAVRRGQDFVTKGTDEDRAMQSAVQRGLAANANSVFTFGLFEGAITRLHRNLAQVLGDRD